MNKEISIAHSYIDFERESNRHRLYLAPGAVVVATNMVALGVAVFNPEYQRYYYTIAAPINAFLNIIITSAGLWRMVTPFHQEIATAVRIAQTEGRNPQTKEEVTNEMSRANKVLAAANILAPGKIERDFLDIWDVTLSGLSWREYMRSMSSSFNERLSHALETVRQLSQDPEVGRKTVSTVLDIADIKLSRIKVYPDYPEHRIPRILLFQGWVKDIKDTDPSQLPKPLSVNGIQI